MVTDICERAVEDMVVRIDVRFIWEIVARLYIKEKSCSFVVAERNEKRTKADENKNEKGGEPVYFIKICTEPVAH